MSGAEHTKVPMLAEYESAVARLKHARDEGAGFLASD
jgi:hypothetical protein